MMQKRNRIFIYSFEVIIVLVLLLNNSCEKKNEPVVLTIGQSHAGGIIFYLDDTKQHGLVCASSDQSAGIPWWNGSNVVVSGAYGSAIGTGKANTEAIVLAQGAGNYAAKICNDLVLNGYSDWFLPSKVECTTMYINLRVMKNIGDFPGSLEELYWSSTEASYNLAYSQYANDGYLPTGGYYKNSLYHVRAVRAF
jgi:hypothetical protein